MADEGTGEKREVPTVQMPTISEEQVREKLSEDAKAALEAMRRVLRLRRLAPSRAVPEVQYYRLD